MKYPFYKHKDILTLYIFIGIFVVGLITSLFLQFFIGFALSGVGLFALLIVLIGHEIMIILLEIKNSLRKR